MNYVDIDVIEYVSQYKIAKTIKEFKTNNNKELVEQVQKIIKNKEKIYNSEK